MFTFFVLVTIYNRSYEYPYQYKGQGVRFVSSMQSLWLLRGIQRYGAYKGKVSYGRQMASTGPKGLMQSSCTYMRLLVHTHRHTTGGDTYISAQFVQTLGPAAGVIVQVHGGGGGG